MGATYLQTPEVPLRTTDADSVGLEVDCVTSVGLLDKTQLIFDGSDLQLVQYI